MKIHEYQAKEALRKYGVKTLRGVVADSVDAAGKAYDQLGGKVVVVKAQIHAGGRGKAGGVKLAKSREECLAHAKAILHSKLVTHQTGAEGKEVLKLLIEEGCAIRKELYVGVAIDRVSACPVLMASSEGGVEIEEVAAKHPEKIIKEKIDPDSGLHGFQARRVARKIGVPGALLGKASAFMVALAKAFVELDCSIAEINPLVLTDDDVIALDAKMVFDDNALFRHQDIVGYRDLSEEKATEIEASKFDLSYIALDGTIGCMVNGAGLAMATMDIVKLHGEEPANFLDVGGGASEEKVTAAFKIILADPKVKGILVNIFGGIMRCDVLAEGIIKATKASALKVPLVVRLEGTKVEEGKEILKKSGLNLISADSMEDAAKKIVEAVRKNSR